MEIDNRRQGGLATYCEAYDIGRTLLHKHGFQDTARSTFRMHEFGYNHTWTHWCMIRGAIVRQDNAPPDEAALGVDEEAFVPERAAPEESAAGAVDEGEIDEEGWVHDMPGLQMVNRAPRSGMSSVDANAAVAGSSGVGGSSGQASSSHDGQMGP